MPDCADERCWLCCRPLGTRIEYHHRTPKTRGRRGTVPIHPICHRILHRTFSNAELALVGESIDHPGRSAHRPLAHMAIDAKPPDFHAPTRGSR